ncbi:MAG TPA: arsenic transporter [Deinococcales bacterium]|nr:arsenic transporter [Deinococcales bacterium]
MILAVGIFLLTLALVIWQPRLPGQPNGLGIGWSASLGAALALVTGVVGLADVPVVIGIIWNATIAFVAVIVISLLLDEAGFFEWAALHVARWGRGNGRWLFALIVLLGSVIAALFANDGAALILTPIVFEMLLALGFGVPATLAFIMANGFIADSSSLPLVVSNLVNIVSADYFKIGFGSYAAVMVAVDLAAILASLAVLFLYFRRSVPRTYAVGRLRVPAGAVRDPATFAAGWAVLALLLAGYFASGPLRVPVSAVAVLGAALLAGVASRVLPVPGSALGITAGGAVDRRAVIPVGKVVREAPWQIVVFSLGMYLVVYGLRNAGLTGGLTALLQRFAAGGVFTAAIGTGFTSAVLSSLMNNMPTVLVGALSISPVQAPPLVREAMVYANVIGCDLGPKITPIGSLATLLWLHVLAKKGLQVGWGTYFRVGIVLTLPVLLVTLAALAAWLSLIH